MIDKNQYFLDQRIDGNSTECVALTVTDICGNIDGQLYDADFVYAFTLYLQGIQPNTAGLDPYAGILSTVAYGLLPISEADFTAKTMGELYVANFENYSKEDVASALRNTRNGVKRLYSYDEIVQYLNDEEKGVSLAVKWFPEFNNPYSGGILPTPNTTGEHSLHNVAVYGSGTNGLQIKPWLSSSYGYGGYGYMNRYVFDQIFEEAFAFDTKAWRWLSLVQMCLLYPSRIKDLLPRVIASSTVR